MKRSTTAAIRATIAAVMKLRPIAPIAAALMVGLFAGLAIGGRYEITPTRTLPVRLDKWTGRTELVVPAAPAPTPFNPDAYLAGK